MSSHFGPGCLAQHRRDIGSAVDGIMGRRAQDPFSLSLARNGPTVLSTNTRSPLSVASE
jgi:hypothetical protein